MKTKQRAESRELKTKTVIPVAEWDALVSKTYGRIYTFQQQDGCQSRGTVEFSVPAEADDYKRDTVPEEVNGPDLGVSFAAWLARAPKQKLSDPEAQADYCLELWWGRNFYPELQMVANDLHAKGLLAAGNHTILIDW